MGARGRPRGFDRAAALEKAMEVFWARGYAGASMAELTEAMGINPPSLYAAFGSKEELFKEAVGLYAATDDGCTLTMLEGDLSTRDSIAAMLMASARSCMRPDKPSGCFLMLGATNGGPDTDAAQAYLCDRRRDMPPASALASRAASPMANCRPASTSTASPPISRPSSGHVDRGARRRRHGDAGRRGAERHARLGRDHVDAGLTPLQDAAFSFASSAACSTQRSRAMRPLKASFRRAPRLAPPSAGPVARNGKCRSHSASAPASARRR